MVIEPGETVGRQQQRAVWRRTGADLDPGGATVGAVGPLAGRCVDADDGDAGLCARVGIGHVLGTDTGAGERHQTARQKTHRAKRRGSVFRRKDGDGPGSVERRSVIAGYDLQVDGGRLRAEGAGATARGRIGAAAVAACGAIPGVEAQCIGKRPCGAACVEIEPGAGVGCQQACLAGRQACEVERPPVGAVIEAEPPVSPRIVGGRDGDAGNRVTVRIADVLRAAARRSEAHQGADSYANRARRHAVALQHRDVGRAGAQRRRVVYRGDVQRRGARRRGFAITDFILEAHRAAPVRTGREGPAIDARAGERAIAAGEHQGADGEGVAIGIASVGEQLRRGDGAGAVLGDVAECDLAGVWRTIDREHLECERIGRDAEGRAGPDVLLAAVAAGREIPGLEGQGCRACAAVASVGRERDPHAGRCAEQAGPAESAGGGDLAKRIPQNAIVDAPVPVAVGLVGTRDGNAYQRACVGVGYVLRAATRSLETHEFGNLDADSAHRRAGTGILIERIGHATGFQHRRVVGGYGLGPCKSLAADVVIRSAAAFAGPHDDQLARVIECDIGGLLVTRCVGIGKDLTTRAATARQKTAQHGGLAAAILSVGFPGDDEVTACVHRDPRSFLIVVGKGVGGADRPLQGTTGIETL